MDFIEKAINRLIDNVSKLDSNFTEIIKLVNQLGSGNFFIAGGSIRDSLLKPATLPKDIDLFVTKKAYSLLVKIITNKGDLKNNVFGSSRWSPVNQEDFYYDIIIIEKFHNGLWKCDTIIDVLNQFDFTANCIAFDLKTREFFNPQNGLLHSKKRILRAIRFDFPEIDVSDSVPISRNSILWFRYQYYAKKLGYTIEPITLKWINDNSFRIKDKELFIRYFFNPDIL